MVLPDHQADAHAFLLLPKTEFTTDKNFYAYVVPGKSVPSENAYFTGNAEKNSEEFKKNYAASNWKNLKEMIFKLQEPSGPYEDRPAGGTAECGFSTPTATPQPLPDKLEYGNYTLTVTGDFHLGPCEAWCDNEIVAPFTEDYHVYMGKQITYAKGVGKSHLTFYWLVTHFALFQVYTAGSTTTVAPKATTTAPKATAKAPKGNNGKVSDDADKPAAMNSTISMPVKCKVKST